MLPNHAPLMVAEQFGTLETLYPGRIDLGVGRAPGADQATIRALRRSLDAHPNQFPNDVVEILNYFEGKGHQGVQAVPGAGQNIPIWILGSSTYGASLAAEELIASSHLKWVAGVHTGQPTLLPPPEEAFMERLSPNLRRSLEQELTFTAIGTSEDVRSGLIKFIEFTQADELMIDARIYDPRARRRSYQLAAESIADLL